MRWGALTAAALALLILGGCGGGGGGGTAAPPGTAKIVGTLQLPDGASPHDFEAYLDGEPVDWACHPDGQFEIDGVPPGEHTVYIVHRNGNEGCYCYCQVEQGEIERLPSPVWPIPTGQVAGLVTDATTGAPIRRAKIVATVPVVQEGEKQADDASDYPYPVVLIAYTDRYGSYRIPCVPTGTWQVNCYKPGYEQGVKTVRVEAGRTAVADFQLQPTQPPGEVGWIEGTVYAMGPWDREPCSGDSGTECILPLPGAVVCAWWQPEVIIMIEDNGDADAAIYPPPPPPRICVYTDQNGRYKLEVPAGKVFLQASARGYLPQRKMVKVSPGEVLQVDFTLRPTQPPIPPPPPRPLY